MSTQVNSWQNSSKPIGATLKLLNINAAAKLLHPDYSGSTLDVAEDALMKDIKVSPGPAKQQFNKSVLEAFSTLFPLPRLSSLHINTLLGFVAEAECVVATTAGSPPISKISKNFILVILMTQNEVYMKTKNYLSDIIDFSYPWLPKNLLKTENFEKS